MSFRKHLHFSLSSTCWYPSLPSPEWPLWFSAAWSKAAKNKPRSSAGEGRNLVSFLGSELACSHQLPKWLGICEQGQHAWEPVLRRVTDLQHKQASVRLKETQTWRQLQGRGSASKAEEEEKAVPGDGVAWKAGCLFSRKNHDLFCSSGYSLMLRRQLIYLPPEWARTRQKLPSTANCLRSWLGVKPGVTALA